MAAKFLFPTSRDIPPSNLRRIADGILNLIYPGNCFICSNTVARLQDCGVCHRCWEKILQLRIFPPWCPSCGIPFQTFVPDAGHLCGDCTLEMPPFSGARSFGYYRSELSRLVQELKFRGRRNLVSLLSPLLARSFVDSWDQDEVDLIVPVPLHPRRKRERGFNQSALLGCLLARLIAVPLCDNTLSRIRHTVPQVGLTDAERLRNVHRAFRCDKPGVVADKRVLLVDDVMTTGATARSASEALLAGGARRVSVLTVARAVPGVIDD